MRINRDNIIDFISYLFWKKKGEAPSQELLRSWEGLSEEEIQMHLSVLFERWGYNRLQQESEISAFLRARGGGEDASERKAEEPEASGDSHFDDYTDSAAARDELEYETQPPKRKRRTGLTVVAVLILIALLASSGYVLFAYSKYKSLGHVYVLTDNVAVRNAAGDIVARMDVYGNPEKNSFSFLRAIDRQTYPLDVDGKTYMYRKVILDSVSFTDYLFRLGEHTLFVNSTFLTDEKTNFQQYREVFRSINDNKKESNHLSSAYRNVIVGSLSQSSKFEGRYIQNTCNTSDKSLSSTIRYSVPGTNVLVVVAKLSDGQYYLFSGNNESGVYEPPRPVYFKTPYVDDMKLLKDQDFVFKKTNNIYYLYKCNGSPIDYYSVLDGTGKISHFKWLYDLEYDPAVDTQAFD